MSRVHDVRSPRVQTVRLCSTVTRSYCRNIEYIDATFREAVNMQYIATFRYDPLDTSINI